MPPCLQPTGVDDAEQHVSDVLNKLMGTTRDELRAQQEALAARKRQLQAEVDRVSRLESQVSLQLSRLRPQHRDSDPALAASSVDAVVRHQVRSNGKPNAFKAAVGAAALRWRGSQRAPPTPNSEI